MADVAVEYTLTTPGPDITFNDGIEPFDTTDKFYIEDIRGLESPVLRTPHDPVPLGDGSLIHDFWYGETLITFEGVVIVNSTTVCDDQIAIRNSMTADLKAALDSILRADGTLTFTPRGESAQSITGLRYFVGLQMPQSNNFRTIDFSFGLVTGTPYS